MPRDHAAAGQVLAAPLLNDDEPLVRLAALLTIADLPPSEPAAQALAKGLCQGIARTDRWLPDALTSAAAVNDAAFFRAIATSQGGKLLGEKEFAIVRPVAEHYAQGAPTESISSLVAALGDFEPKLAGAIVAGLARGWPRYGKAVLGDAAEQALGRLMMRLPVASKAALVSLAGRLGSKRLDEFSVAISSDLIKAAGDPSRSDTERIAAAFQLTELRGDVDSARSLLALITPRISPARRGPGRGRRRGARQADRDRACRSNAGDDSFEPRGGTEGPARPGGLDSGTLGRGGTEGPARPGGLDSGTLGALKRASFGSTTSRSTRSNRSPLIRIPRSQTAPRSSWPAVAACLTRIGRR